MSLSEEKRTFARETIEKDREINQLDYEINEKVIMLITKQQPIATDLRMMMAALKFQQTLKEWEIMLRVSRTFV